MLLGKARALLGPAKPKQALGSWALCLARSRSVWLGVHCRVGGLYGGTTDPQNHDGQVPSSRVCLA